jgi:hypothetical protein
MTILTALFLLYILARCNSFLLNSRPRCRLLGFSLFATPPTPPTPSKESLKLSTIQEGGTIDIDIGMPPSFRMVELERLNQELSELQNEHQYYYAIMQRNEAQIDSFVDETAQWLAQDQGDRDIIANHPNVLKQMEEIENLILNLPTL